ncbi:hypothetical protein SAMN02745157_3377 [Kaistia soli DSM 19436]|uniref:Uncharacterized protein n=1 Tax=Kaistia soli DSM 19436 TaxID=1122133 RepID=A0A1M5GE99_9HYPH|nr:hypothetical protein SAMN02745157_3377 [Kaistia soli DSM 19436]
MTSWRKWGCFAFVSAELSPNENDDKTGLGLLRRNVAELSSRRIFAAVLQVGYHSYAKANENSDNGSATVPPVVDVHAA